MNIIIFNLYTLCVIFYACTGNGWIKSGVNNSMYRRLSFEEIKLLLRQLPASTKNYCAYYYLVKIND